MLTIVNIEDWRYTKEKTIKSQIKTKLKLSMVNFCTAGSLSLSLYSRCKSTNSSSISLYVVKILG
jgi:hypothetical protein